MENINYYITEDRSKLSAIKIEKDLGKGEVTLWACCPNCNTQPLLVTKGWIFTSFLSKKELKRKRINVHRYIGDDVTKFK